MPDTQTIVRPTHSLECYADARGCLRGVNPRYTPLCRAYHAAECNPPEPVPAHPMGCVDLTMLAILFAVIGVAWFRYDHRPEAVARREALREEIREQRKKDQKRAKDPWYWF